MYISKKRHELLSPLYIYDSDDDRSSFLHFRKVNFRLLNIIKVDQAEHLERILLFFFSCCRFVRIPSFSQSKMNDREKRNGQLSNGGASQQTASPATFNYGCISVIGSLIEISLLPIRNSNYRSYHFRIRCFNFSISYYIAIPIAAFIFSLVNFLTINFIFEIFCSRFPNFLNDLN